MNPSKASHYRAGEIIYEQISGRLYRVFVYTYTDPSQDANQFTGTIQINWGDGSSEVLNRSSRSLLMAGTTQENVYIGQHTYSSEGVYRVNVVDPNRVENILNINNGNNTDDIAFYVESVIRISNSLGNNQSPKLTVKPVLNGCFNFFYMHNPGAYDPDGDSLVYSLGIPRDGEGNPVPNYILPAHTDSFTINPKTGSIFWVMPRVQGLFNILIRVTEYRGGREVGYVERDMQIRILDCINEPPVSPPLPNSCVTAGETVRFTITSTDVNVQTITIRGVGGPFSHPVSPARLSPNPGQGVSLATTEMIWRTTCSHIRQQPHIGTIESMDNFTGNPMATYSNFEVKVVPPKPGKPQLVQRGNGFLVSWPRDTCVLANRYVIYRKLDSSQYTFQRCQTGIPPSLGFSKIGEVVGQTNALTDTVFYDDNGGEGLSPLVNYCYRIVAFYPARRDNGSNLPGGLPSESYVSDESCDAIILSKPIHTRISVSTTSLINGAMLVSWIRPDTLDTTVYTPPYRIVVKRAPFELSGKPGVYTPIKTFTYSAFYLINDTFTIDTNINTLQQEFSYRAELQRDSSGQFVYVDQSPQAGSLFVNMYSTDNTNILSWKEKVPWLNTLYTIYKRNAATNAFDSITSQTANSFKDTGLINGVTLEYKVRSTGKYSFYDSTLINFSQEVSGTPLDTVKPCSPILSVATPCNQFDDFSNKLSWIPRGVCANDVLSYRIYYKKFPNDSFTIIGTAPYTVLSFQDSRDTLKFSIAGCYAVTSIDSVGNESLFDNVFCVDNCPFYSIPNVFTPGNDSRNDLLKPFPYRFIDKIDLRIYNRWGQEVFKTENPDINWNGKDAKNGMDCSDGTYFYTLTIFEQYLNELKNRKSRGTLKLIR